MFPALSLFILSLLSVRGQAALYSDPSKLPSTKYDFVIVGAGTAGNVIANRLTEDSSVKVLVIEAGVSNTGDEADLIQIPFFGPQASPNTIFDWNYTTTAQVGLNNQTQAYPRGHVIGGSSSINFMVYTRGSSNDYDRFAQVSGDNGWTWNNLLPYVFKHEKHVASADGHNTTGQFDPAVHGFNGPLLTSLPGFSLGTDDRVIDTTREVQEFPFNLDMNSGSPLGIGWTQSTIGNGTRSSSATAYLAPALNGRQNLDVLYNTQVTRLFQTGSSGSVPVFNGVEFSQGPTAPRYNVTAGMEVVLSAGAIGTPQILMLSGIGDSKALSSLGIKPIVNLPDVGQNLQDHPFVPLQWSVNSTDTLDVLGEDPSVLATALAQYNLNRTGVLADNPVSNQLGFFRLPSNSSILSTYGDPTAGPKSPHYELAFGDGFVTTSQAIPTSGNYFTVMPILVAPTARGSVTLTSASAFDHPLINPALLSNEQDLLTMIEAVKASQRFVAASPWKGYIGAPFVDSANTTTDAGITAYLRKWTVTIRHPTGTAKVSKTSDKTGVVGPDLTVKNVKGVRIMDASVLPFVTGGHPQAPLYIFAERAADLIKAAHGIRTS